MSLTMGEILKDARIQRGMTSKQVCDEIKERYHYHISVGKYNEMEMDVEKDFGYKSIFYLAKFFDISADYLIGMSNEPCTIDDIKPIIKYTGLSCEALEFIKSNSAIINIMFETDCTQDILLNLKEIYKLSREQRYTENWWGKYDIPSLEYDGILTPVKHSDLDSLISRALMNDMHYESNGDASACINILQDKIDLFEYSIQKSMFKILEYIENFNRDDSKYFKKRYSKAFDEVSKELDEDIAYYKEMIEEQGTLKGRWKCLPDKIAELKKWLTIFETEALNNGKHNAKEK